MSVGICIINSQTGPLCHLTQMSVSIVEILDGCDVSVWCQVEGKLQARLEAKNTGQDCDVVLLIEHLVCGPILLASIMGSHVANYLIGI